MMSEHISEVLRAIPRAKRWAVFSRSPGRSLGILIYDTEKSDEHPIYILELPYEKLGFIMVMPDDKESVELIMGLAKVIPIAVCAVSRTAIAEMERWQSGLLRLS